MWGILEFGGWFRYIFVVATKHWEIGIKLHEESLTTEMFRSRGIYFQEYFIKLKIEYLSIEYLILSKHTQDIT